MSLEPTLQSLSPWPPALLDDCPRLSHCTFPAPTPSFSSSTAAEAALAAQPDILINRIVAQFQRLFACRSLEGVLPAMNKLYLQHTGAEGACVW